MLNIDWTPLAKCTKRKPLCGVTGRLLFRLYGPPMYEKHIIYCIVRHKKKKKKIDNKTKTKVSISKTFRQPSF